MIDNKNLLKIKENRLSGGVRTLLCKRQPI